MKKILPLLWFLLLFAFQAKAQQTHYKSIFGSQSTSWEFAWENFSGINQSIIAVQKDTVVNALAYKKIILQGYPVNSGTFLGGLLREDTVAGKVWLKHLYVRNPPPLDDPRDTIEMLIFDYSLSVGDTFDISGSGYGVRHLSPDSLNIVDSVYYKNGLKHIRFVKGAPFATEPPIFIEGIGSNLGVIWRNHQGIFTQQYLLCSFKNGVKTSHTNARFNGSCSILGLPKEKLVPKIRLYPNPAQNQVFFDLPEKLRAKTVIVRNNAGQQVLEQQAGAVSGINISALPPGFYHLQLVLSGNKYFAGSFIKLH